MCVGMKSIIGFGLIRLQIQVGVKKAYQMDCSALWLQLFQRQPAQFAIA